MRYDKIIPVRVSSEQQAFIKAQSIKKGVTMSEIVRRMISKGKKKDDKKH